MFYVFFDSVLVCGALFDTAFHEVLITCLLVVRWFVLARRASQEGNKGNQDGFEAILIAYVWVS